MSTALHFDTHEIFNQSPPYEDIDLFSSDAPLVDAVKANGGGGETAALSAFGRQWGTAEMFALGAARQRESAEALHLRPEGLSPRRRRVPSGLPRVDAGEHRSRTACSTLTPSGKRAAPPAEVARAARYYMAAQVESGHLCPITMTRAALAALAAEPALLAKIAAKVATTSYDPAFRPWREKSGMTLGMGMTEKQGGTDVRANSTRRHAPRAIPIPLPATNGFSPRRCATPFWCWRRRRAGSPAFSCRAFGPTARSTRCACSG